MSGSKLLSFSKSGKLYWSPRTILLGLICHGIDFQFGKVKPGDFFLEMKRSLYVLKSVLSEPSSLAPQPLSYWADTHPRPPGWCWTRWGATRRSGCWARWCTPRTGCRSGCWHASPRGARTRWRTEHRFHTPELPCPLQRWFLVWQRTWFHLETQRKQLVGFQSK